MENAVNQSFLSKNLGEGIPFKERDRMKQFIDLDQLVIDLEEEVLAGDCNDSSDVLRLVKKNLHYSMKEAE